MNRMAMSFIEQKKPGSPHTTFGYKQTGVEAALSSSCDSQNGTVEGGSVSCVGNSVSS